MEANSLNGDSLQRPSQRTSATTPQSPSEHFELMDLHSEVDVEDGQPKYVIFKDEDLFNESFPNFNEIRRKGQLCDVILKVEDQVFSAHRIILAGTIPYFYAMFTNNMAESRIKEITMKEIEPSALEALINFAYSGKVRIDNSNVQSLMVGASFLLLTKVRDFCSDYLISRLHPHNVLGIRHFADSLGCTELITAADNFINEHFQKVTLEDEFLTLEFEELLELIRRDELNILTEEVVFEACLKWVKYSEEKRKNLFPQLLSQVRLPLMTPQFLADRVAREDLIRSSHQCRELLDEANNFHLMPERRSLLPSFRTRQRCIGMAKGQIYIVGGLDSNGECISTVEIYDPLTEKWRIGEQMSMMRYHVGVAVMNGKLYAFGGFNGTESLSTVEVYDPKKNKWYQGREMLCKRSSVGVAALGDNIYVCGGFLDGGTSLNTVDCYYPKADAWRTVAPMMKFCWGAGVAALNGFVYALGGQDGRSFFDSVERYDPVKDVWLKMKTMLNRRCMFGVAALNGKLYACGGYNENCFLRSVEMYDPQTDNWQLVTPMNCKRSDLALTANMGKLWAIGGYDGETNLSTVEVYDPETDVWTFVASMAHHRSHAGAGVIRRY